MNLPLVTISIPIYQCENYIINCLKSVVSQTYQNLEILLVDDLGNDDSMLLVEDFVQKNLHLNFKILKNKKNSGLSVVRNVGIDNAQGKYIFFLDSDDEITPDCISKMVEIAEREQVQMVCGNTIGYKVSNKISKELFIIKSEKDIITNADDAFDSFINGEYPVNSCNKLIRVDFLKKNKLYFTRDLFAQDSLQSFETALKLQRIAFLKESTYIYNLHDESVIHNRNKRNFDNWITIISIIEKYYKLEKNKDRKSKILSHIVDYKDATLLMNWKAQKNEQLWKYSYDAYKKIASLSFADYWSSDFSKETKKKNFLQNLPTDLGYKIFRKRFGS